MPSSLALLALFIVGSADAQCTTNNASCMDANKLGLCNDGDPKVCVTTGRCAGKVKGAACTVGAANGKCDESAGNNGDCIYTASIKVDYIVNAPLDTYGTILDAFGKSPYKDALQKALGDTFTVGASMKGCSTQMAVSVLNGKLNCDNASHRGGPACILTCTAPSYGLRTAAARKCNSAGAWEGDNGSCDKMCPDGDPSISSIDGAGVPTSTGALEFLVTGGHKLICTDRLKNGATPCALTCKQGYRVTVKSNITCSNAPTPVWAGTTLGTCTKSDDFSASAEILVPTDVTEEAVLAGTATTVNSAFKARLAAALSASNNVNLLDVNVTIVGYKSVPSVRQLREPASSNSLRRLTGETVQVDFTIRVADDNTTNVKNAIKVGGFPATFSAPGLVSAQLTLSKIIDVCPAVPAVTGGTLICPDTFARSSTPCTLTCEDGKNNITPPTTMCSGTGAWTGDNGTCTTQCPNTFTDANGSNMGTVSEDGKTVMFTTTSPLNRESGTVTCSTSARLAGASSVCSLVCAQDYNKVLGSTAKCNDTGSAWTGTLGQCDATKTYVAATSNLVLAPGAPHKDITAMTNTDFNTKFKTAVAASIAGVNVADVKIVRIRYATTGDGRRLSDNSIEVDYVVAVPKGD